MAFALLVKAHDHGGGNVLDYIGIAAGVVVGAALLLKTNVQATYTDGDGRIQHYADPDEDDTKKPDIFF